MFTLFKITSIHMYTYTMSICMFNFNIEDVDDGGTISEAIRHETQSIAVSALTPHSLCHKTCNE